MLPYFFDVITGLITGGIVVLAGYLIWKRQVAYQKKIELYHRAVSTLSFAR